MKAMTKTAITIVMASDCREFMPPEGRRAGWCGPEVFGSCVTVSTDNSVRTCFMKVARTCSGYPFPLSQNLSLGIVENPKPPAQLVARPAFWYCPRRGGQSPFPRGERPGPALHGEHLTMVGAFFPD